MKKIVDEKGQDVDVNKLSDATSILLDKIKEIDLTEIKKHGGSFFVWGMLPESQKLIMQKYFPTKDAWTQFLKSVNVLFMQSTDNKFELVIRPKE